jgi:hypothetical protein
MISSSVFENSTASMADAWRADLTEALLRGELLREEFDRLILLYNKQNKDENRE